MLKNLKKKINEDYMHSEISKMEDGDLEVVMDNNENISNKISNAGMLKKYTELAKVMVGMIKDYKKGIYKNVPWFTIAAIAFSLLYILNPLDIVPDFIPGLGYVDDLAVFTFALKFIQNDLHNYLDWKIESQKA
ncbi:MAG TPA: YkvA family protein [Salinimicrobium sp.]|nr:YkvA family protein [Salinimicrobium sp.]